VLEGESPEDEPLEELPPEIRSLTALRELNLAGCRLESLPDWLSELTSLEVLELADNPISVLPPPIGALTSLRALGLSGTPIATLDGPLRNLKALEVLAAPGARLYELPSWLGELESLRIIDIGANEIEGLPHNTRLPPSLTHLIMWGHRLREFPSALGQLHHLEVLDLSDSGRSGTREASIKYHNELYAGLPFITNRLVGQRSANGNLRALPEWLADAFPALRVLDVSGQRLQALPARLPEELEAIYLTSNRIDVFPAAIVRSSKLRALDLQGNRLKALPADLSDLSTLRYFNLADNDLAIPPEILAQRGEPDAIIDYAARVRGPTRPLDQAKLLIVGEGSVGKTSLVKRLTSDDYSAYEQKTDGIEVSRWSIDIDAAPILLNVWDFGGQEIMHATHQFFLTKRSLYVLVIDARQGEEQNRVEYWLKLIVSFADASPILIIANKTEESPMDIDSRGLMAKYPNIVGVLPVSCKTGAGIDSVKSSLAAAIGHMPHVRDLLPLGFFEVKRVLEASDANYLSFQEYEELCVEKDVTSKHTQEQLVAFLHDLGTVLCFRDDPRLADTNILNPGWVTGGVYRLLNSNLAAQHKGLLAWRDVDEILNTPEYPRERRAFIIEMMKRFELCFESDKLLIPDLLTRQEPDTGTWDSALQFEIKYDVLPTSIISRLIVRMSGSLSKETVWRTGLVLAIDRNRALVKGDREDAIVKIAVVGPAASRRGLLTAIRTELRVISESIPGLTCEERVPVPGQPNVWVPYAHLLELEAAGHSNVIPQGLTESFSIRELLDGVETPADRLEERMYSSPGAQQPPSSSISRVDDAAPPWTSAESMRLGAGLLVALVVVVGLFVGTDAAVGTAPAAGITSAAVIAVVVIAALVLRSAGRISENGMVATLRNLLGQ
jgi:internalin A